MLSIVMKIANTHY